MPSKEQIEKLHEAVALQALDELDQKLQKEMEYDMQDPDLIVAKCNFCGFTNWQGHLECPDCGTPFY